MIIVYTILSIIVLLIAVLLISALFIKKDYVVEREIIIDKPTPPVFEYVKYLKNQDYYSKWVMLDPGMKKDFKGIDGTPGFVYAWDSNNKNAGKGEQEIRNVISGQAITTEVRFEKPFKNIAYTYISTEPVTDDQTKVKWGMQGKNTYPVNVINAFIKKMLGKDMEISLINLKKILEKE